MTEKERYKFKREGVNDFDEYGLESPILLEEDVLTYGEVIDKLNEQEELINRLKQIREEQIETILKQKRKIKELTAQLKTDDEDDICIKCKHHYLINYPESSKYYISKCKKEHEECSKEDIRFCEDFELKEENIE